jgi:hypothetical protein
MLAVIGTLAMAAAMAPGCPDAPPGEALFPPATFSTNASTDEIGRRWFGRYLRAFGESSLACAAEQPGRTFRLLWLPSTIRMRDPGVHARLVVVTFASGEVRITGKTLPWKRARVTATSTSRRLDAARWRALEARFDRAEFWQAERMGRAAIDGDAWVFEGRRPGRYQVVVRSSGRLGPFGEAGDELLRLAGLTPPR